MGEPEDSFMDDVKKEDTESGLVLDELDTHALKRKSAQGAAISLATQLFKFVAQLVYLIILMRLLTPADFGLVALASPVLWFVQMFTDFGLSQAVVQRKQITQEQLSSLFWFNVLVSAALCAVTIALAPLVGAFYGEPKATPIVMALGAMLILGGLQTQPTGLLNRHMEYRKLAIVNITSIVAGIGVGLVSALGGLGYWSIVVSQAASSLVALCFSWILANWRPGKPVVAAELAELIGFGGNLTGFNVVNFFARNLDNILIGRYCGSEALGLYDRAYRLLLLPINQIVAPIAAVALPLLARTRHNDDVYRESFLRTVQTVVLLTYPGTLCAMCTSTMLVTTVLGHQWSGVAPIFSVLAIGGLFAPIGHSTGWIFVSQERTREMRNWGVLSSALCVLSFLIGLPWGPIGVAISYTATSSIQGPVLWWAATRRGPVSFRDLLKALYPLNVGAIAVLAAVSYAQFHLPPSLFSLAVLFVLAHVVYLMTVAAMPSGRLLLGKLIAQWEHFRLK
jgi:polysaccharide transporter, PST family